VARAEAQAAATSVTRSVMDGVYTTAQAERGRGQYETQCILCHLDRGVGQQAETEIVGESLEREGDAAAPPLAGAVFREKWTDRTVQELFEITATTMPPGGEGTLSSQQVADLLAYLFELNLFPAGSQELPPAGDQLTQIAIAN
jgi:cytochrome c